MVKTQPPTRQPIELWSYARISEHTGIAGGTLRQWRNRDKMPPPDFIVGDFLAWAPSTIEKWWENIIATKQQGDDD